MGRPKLDPEAATRDMFTKEEPSDAPKERARKTRRNAARKGSTKPETSIEYLNVVEVAARYGVSRATIWRWVSNDAQFPAPIQLSPGTSRWRIEELRTFEQGAAQRSKKSVGQSNSSPRQAGKRACK